MPGSRNLNHLLQRSARGQKAFAIGLTVCFDILAGGPITGASMNPARSFGPALLTHEFSRHWCYWVGPGIGGISAGLIYQYFLLKEE
jgi:aquaporin TIP